MDIAGKVCVITGASEGIGLATARCFAARGAKVVLAARSVDKLDAAVEGLRRQGHEAISVPTDMCNPEAVRHLIDRTVERYGRIDLLVNNAGRAAKDPVAEAHIEDLRAIMELNVYGALYAIQAVVPHMRHAGGGVIVNVSSMVSKRNTPRLGPYAATKAALNQLSATARGELAADNIRVVTVYPRRTATDFGVHSLGNRGTREQDAADRAATDDSAEFVAEKIWQAVQNEPAEQYMDT